MRHFHLKVRFERSLKLHRLEETEILLKALSIHILIQTNFCIGVVVQVHRSFGFNVEPLFAVGKHIDKSLFIICILAGNQYIVKTIVVCIPHALRAAGFSNSSGKLGTVTIIAV